VQNFNTPDEKATCVLRAENLSLLLYLVFDTDKRWSQWGAGHSSHCCCADAGTIGPALAVGLLVVGVVGFIGRREVINCVCVCVCVCVCLSRSETFSSTES